MRCMTEEYESHRVSVEGRTPIEGYPQGMLFGSQTSSSTPLAMEISTPWEFIVATHHPDTLS